MSDELLWTVSMKATYRALDRPFYIHQEDILLLPIHCP